MFYRTTQTCSSFPSPPQIFLWFQIYQPKFLLQACPPIHLSIHRLLLTKCWNFCCENTYSLQRWTDSPLLWFMIHLDSQAGCDNSIQLNSYFPRCSRETRFLIPNYISIEVNDSSVILSELWQTGTDLTQFIHEIQCKMLQIHPFAHLPHIFPTYLPNQFNAVSYLMWLALQRAALIFNEMNKINFLHVSLSSLYHWGYNLKVLYSGQDSDPN